MTKEIHEFKKALEDKGQIQAEIKEKYLYFLCECINLLDKLGNETEKAIFEIQYEKIRNLP